MQLASRAAELVVETHRVLASALKTGMTLGEIDRLVGTTLEKLGTKSAFLHYTTGRYPKFPSHACLSVNDVIVHGTAGMSLKPLKPGDLISIDIGTVYRGWIGDAAWTYILEEATDESRRLCECGMEALRRGVDQLQPGRQLVDWARTVQKCVEDEYGFFCVSGLGGHGYGRELHTEPHVANSVPPFLGDWPEAEFQLTPGLLLAVEPIIAVGTRAQAPDPSRGKGSRGRPQWPIRTADGSLSVHYEHDVLITEGAPRVLTVGLEELPLIVG